MGCFMLWASSSILKLALVVCAGMNVSVINVLLVIIIFCCIEHAEPYCSHD